MGDDQRDWMLPTPPRLDELEPTALPSVPSMSKLDTLPEDFIAALTSRPHQPGDLLAGRYRLVQALGEGAMGEVFVAETAIGRRVAVKILRRDLLADRSFRQRFQHEAEATAAVEHRNVARFIDLVIGDPTFLVTEYVTGPTLAAVLKREGKLAWPRAVPIIVRLAWALEAAHQQGIVHRDVKPGNVILASDPELGDDPKLIDFGLAKMPTIVGAESLTRTGQIVGTPHYMSPEQIANRDIDARSDVYALGCLAYHVLAGRPPFHGGDDVQILYRQIEESPPPLTTHVAGVPAQLEAVVMRALAKRPDDRFASMRDFAVALGELRAPLPSEGTTARGPSPPPRVWPYGLLAIAVAAVTGVALGLHTRHRDAARLLLSSRPSGATTLVDGRPLAETTPTVATDLTPGRHRVRMQMAGHDGVEQVVELGPKARVLVEMALPAASRAVEVRTVPAGAQMFVDDAQVPGETPLTVHLAADDFHEVRVEKSGFEPATRAIKPEDREPAVTLTLDPERVARGRVIVDGDGGDVYIDGKASGFTAPTIPIIIAAGTHQIELRDAATQRHASATVDVKQGEVVRLHLGFSTP